MEPVASTHFIGIGGAGMSALAEILLDRGSPVSGSDLCDSQKLVALRRRGARICLGHNADQLADAGLVVYSTAVRQDNPELVEAACRGLPVFRRGEFLAELMRGTNAVAIAGSHGKTSTTAMTAHALIACGFEPSVALGGTITGQSWSGRHGRGTWFIAEADESDGSFLWLAPSIAVVTNIDREHLDHYINLAALHHAFQQFIEHTAARGRVILNVDDPVVRHLGETLPDARVIRYGLTSPAAQLTAEDISGAGLGHRFVPVFNGRQLPACRLNIPGLHMVSNALAAVAVLLEAGVPAPRAVEALSAYPGVERRMQVKGSSGDIIVIDDYGHHPTELLATIRALRLAYNRPLRVVFQPHRYTRTRDLIHEFSDALIETDTLWILDIYAAGEPGIPGVTAREIFLRLKERGHPDVYAPCADGETLSILLKRVAPGDVLLTLGAGDVYKIGELFLAARRGRENDLEPSSCEGC